MPAMPKAKRPPGRPKLYDVDRRDYKFVGTHLRKQEADAIETAADKFGVSQAAIIRWAIQRFLGGADNKQGAKHGERAGRKR